MEGYKSLMGIWNKTYKQIRNKLVKNQEQHWKLIRSKLLTILGTKQEQDKKNQEKMMSKLGTNQEQIRKKLGTNTEQIRNKLGTR